MANFRKDSGHSPFGVECIARLTGVEKNDEGKTTGYYVEFQTNEAVHSSSDISHGKGQENPYLMNRYNNPNAESLHKKCDNSSVRLSVNQFDKLKEAVGDNLCKSEMRDAGLTGEVYGAFKADITIPVKGKIVTPDGKEKETYIGMMPNPKTFAPSDFFNEDNRFDTSDITRHVKNVIETNKLYNEKRAERKAKKAAVPKKFSELSTGVDASTVNTVQNEDAYSLG